MQHFKIILLLILGLSLSTLHAETHVAGVEVLFNQINQNASKYCPDATKAALLNNPIKVTLIISQNAKLNYGFGDLLLDGDLFSNKNYLPQLLLANEGTGPELMLMGLASANDPIEVLVNKDFKLHLKEIITRNITPMNGNIGTATLLLTFPNTTNHEICAVNGQVLRAIPIN